MVGERAVSSLGKKPGVELTFLVSDVGTDGPDRPSQVVC